MPEAVAWAATAVANWVAGAVYNGLTAIGVSAATASTWAGYAGFVAGAAVQVTAVLAPAILGPRPDQPGLESAKEASNQTRAPRRWALGGTQRLGGPRLLFASVRNYGFDVLYHCEGPAASFGQTWLHDDEVTLDEAGFVQALEDGSYRENKVSVHGKLGLPGQTAIAELTAVAGGLWTSLHKATGCVISGLILRKTADDKVLKIYRLGRPRLSRLVTFAVYDFRKDSTVPGGSGPQRRNQPETWGPCANPVACMIHTELHRFGANWERRFLPTLEVNRASAEVCDQLVETYDGGTEPRYEIHGSFLSSDDRAAVRRWYLETMDGSLFRRPDGSVEIRAGKYEPATWTLPSRHVISVRKTAGRDAAARINVLTGSFCSPAHGWTEQQVTAIRDEDDIALRGEQSEEVRMTLVKSHDQWRRLAWRRWTRRRTGGVFTVVTGLWGLTWPGHRWITLGALAGGPPSLAADQEVEVLGVRKMFPLRVEFTLASSTGPAIDAPELAPGPGVTARPPRVDTPAPELLSAAAVFIGDVRVINADVDPGYEPGLGGNRFGLRWRLQDEDLGPEEGWTQGAAVLADEDATALRLQSAALSASGVYEVAVRAFVGGVVSDWSDPHEVDGTTPPEEIAALEFPSGPFRVGVAAANHISDLADWTYSRAGSATAQNADGSFVVFAPDAERITDRGLLIEAAKTNLFPQSDALSALTSAVNLTNGTDATTAPTGVAARKLSATAAGATLAAQTVASAGSAAGNVFSLLVKKGSGATTANRFAIFNNTTSANALSISFNFDTGAITYLVGSSGAAATALGGGWWLLTLSATTGISAGNTLTVYPGFVGQTAAAGDHLYASACQLETGTARSSYIPSGASATTRPADAATLTLPAGSSGDAIEIVHTGGVVETTRGALADPLVLDLGGASGGAWVGQHIETVRVLAAA